MHMPDKYKKFRIKRKPLHIENAEGWAVSYSDLLMVLMSFFIIYFQINDKQSLQEESFHKVVLELSKIASVKDISRAPATTYGDHNVLSKKLILSFNMDEKPTPIPINVTSSSDSTISAMKSSFTKENDPTKRSNSQPGTSLEINIDLPLNIYQIGSFELNQKAKSELDRIFNLIRPHKDTLNMVFVGHTDQIRFDDKAKNIINSNLILSSMRAAKAVEYALKEGFGENMVFVQGLNDHPRNTRSLSLRLVER